MNELDLTPFKVNFHGKIEWWDTKPGDFLVLRKEQLWHFVRRQLTGEYLQCIDDHWGDIEWDSFIKEGWYVIEAVYRLEFKYPEKCMVEG